MLSVRDELRVNLVYRKNQYHWLIKQLQIKTLHLYYKNAFLLKAALRLQGQ